MTHGDRLKIGALLIAAVALIAVGCGDDDEGAGTSPQVIEGKFDVGNHSLYMRCEGTGSPTIVYLHGLGDEGAASSASAGTLPGLLGREHRYCGYDRANTGRSDKVRGPLDGESSVRDLHALLREAEIEPPYVLLAASFGGLIAHTYAATYPEEIAGMVLLDASFPDELDLEHLFPKGDRLVDFSPEWRALEEKIEPLFVYRDSHALKGDEPAIPVTYLLAKPYSWTGPPAYEDVVIDRIRAYVDRYSPGVVKEVESPHYMEEAVPEIITKEVAALIADLPG